MRGGEKSGECWEVERRAEERSARVSCSIAWLDTTGGSTAARAPTTARQQQQPRTEAAAPASKRERANIARAPARSRTPHRDLRARARPTLGGGASEPAVYLIGTPVQGCTLCDALAAEIMPTRGWRRFLQPSFFSFESSFNFLICAIRTLRAPPWQVFELRWRLNFNIFYEIWILVALELLKVDEWKKTSVLSPSDNL